MKQASIIIITVLFISCGNGSNNQVEKDSTAIKDSMPVVQPQIQDTAGIIHTPPVHDSNVVKPDTSIKSK